MTAYRDRRTGRLIDEDVFAGRAIRWFYTPGFGSLVFEKVVNTALFCDFYGRLQDGRGSARRIPEFMARFHLDPSEFEKPLYAYRTFNQFFARKLKPEARPFDGDHSSLPAPAEGKVLVFPHLESDTKIPIKGAAIGIESLLSGAEPHEPYRGGSALLVRLAPYDYHRFHFPDDATAGRVYDIPGRYHSVNPFALSRIPDVYCRNKRTVTRVETAHFGRVAYVEIGALCVGTICQTFQPGDVARGQEKGYFRFGGSTVVLLFEPGRVVFDEDLCADSATGMEVQVQVGSRIGRRAATFTS